MQKLTRCLLIFSLALLGTVSTAQAGELKFREQKKPGRMAYGEVFRYGNLKNAKGLVSKDAKTSLTHGIAIALDKESADAKEFDVLRVDFTGKGDFTNAAKVKLQVQYINKHAYRRMGWTTVDAKIGGKDAKIKMIGGQGRNCFHIRFATELAGKVKFGKNEYEVVIIDPSQRLKFGVAPKTPVSNYWTLNQCNAVYVKTKSGTKKAYLNQPVFVDGKWYIAKYKNYTLTAEEYKGKLGKIKVDVAKWAIDLSGKKYIMTINGNKDSEIEVPVDEYKVAGYYTCLSKDKPGPAIKSYGSQHQKINVEENKTVTVNIGKNVVFNIGARQHGRKIRLGVYLSDMIRSRTLVLFNEKGKRTAAPKVEIYKDGKLIHTISLKYG